MDYTEKYPWLRDSDDPYVVPDDTWLDSVPEGWKAAFLETCETILQILTENKVAPEALKFIQVKEKFGALRIYSALEAEDQGVHGLIRNALYELEEKTAKMCINCGAPATYMSTGWILPNCWSCAVAANNAANERHKTNIPFDKAFKKMELH